MKDNRASMVLWLVFRFCLGSIDQVHMIHSFLILALIIPDLGPHNLNRRVLLWIGPIAYLQLIDILNCIFRLVNVTLNLYCICQYCLLLLYTGLDTLGSTWLLAGSLGLLILEDDSFGHPLVVRGALPDEPQWFSWLGRSHFLFLFIVIHFYFCKIEKLSQ